MTLHESSLLSRRQPVPHCGQARARMAPSPGCTEETATTTTGDPPTTAEQPDASGVPEQPAPAPTRMTFEEYLAWSDGEKRSEWVDGELVPMSPCSIPHQQLLGFLYELVVAFVRQHRLGVVLFAPTLMR